MGAVEVHRPPGDAPTDAELTIEQALVHALFRRSGWQAKTSSLLARALVLVNGLAIPVERNKVVVSNPNYVIAVGPTDKPT